MNMVLQLCVRNFGAHPTSVQGLNACVASGSLPGNKCTVADAAKAYVQALLKPPELRLRWWHDRFQIPVVLLIQALSDPDAGGL